MIWLKTSVQGLASRRIWGYMSLESQVGCGNGISASWEDGKVHHLLPLMNLSSKATLESHTVGIREWIKKKVIWLWQHPSLSKRLLLSALMRLKKGSDCALGSCCKNCKFLKVTTPCYLIADECDLQEYCNGTSKCCKQIPISKMAPLQITRLLLPGPVVRPRESAW